MIIVDTREQKPWDFTFYGHEVISAKLEFGDYSVVGKTNEIFIERKASTSELSNNLCTKEGYRRFDAEMERSGSARKILICEFPKEYLDIFPDKSGIPKSKLPFLRIGAKFLRKRLYEIVEKYNIELHFANSVSEAETMALSILEEFL
jgi:ERCC4-type nuclease